MDRLLMEIQRRLEQLAGSMFRLEGRMSAAEQSQAKAWANMPPASTGGGGTAGYWCVVPSGGPFAGASMMSPTNFVADDVYSLDGSPASVATSATVYYHPPIDIESGDTVMLLRNANGSYSVINKVCTE